MNYLEDCKAQDAGSIIQQLAPQTVISKQKVSKKQSCFCLYCMNVMCNNVQFVMKLVGRDGMYEYYDAGYRDLTGTGTRNKTRID